MYHVSPFSIQAAARVWRDGQKKKVYIYRFLTRGSIEEKVFQRQISKEGLQSLVDNKAENNSFSSSDLAELFSPLNLTSLSTTHDIVKCKRCKVSVESNGRCDMVDTEDEDFEDDDIRTVEEGEGSRSSFLKSPLVGLHGHAKKKEEEEEVEEIMVPQVGHPDEGQSKCLLTISIVYWIGRT